MATEADNIPPPIAETCREEKETEKLTEAANVALDKSAGINEPLPDKHADTMRKQSEVADTKEAIEESNTGSIEGECFYKSPSAAKVADEQKISMSEQNEAAEVLYETESKVSESSIGIETKDKHAETISTVKENSGEEIQQISKETLSGHDTQLNASIVIEDNVDLREANSCQNVEGKSSKPENPSDMNEEATEIGEDANRNQGSQLTAMPTDETCLPKVGSDDIQHIEAIKSSDHLADEHITEPDMSCDGNTQTSINSESLSPDEQTEKKETESSKNDLLDASLIADIGSNKDVNLEKDTSSTLEKTSEDARELSKSTTDTNSEECQIQSTKKTGYSGIESEDLPFQKDDKPLPSSIAEPENVSCSQNLTRDANTEPNSKVDLASTEASVGEYKDEERCTIAPEIHTEVREERKFKDDETFLPQSETIQMNPEEPLNVAPDEIDASVPCQNTETATTSEKQRSNIDLPEVSKEGSKDEAVDADSSQDKQTSEGKNISRVDLNEGDGIILLDTAKDLKSNIPLVEETKQEQDFEENSITESSNSGQALAEGTPDIDVTSTSQLVNDKLETETKSDTTDEIQPHAENNPEDKLQQHGEVSEKQDCEAPSPIENTIHGSETTFEASSVTSSEEACVHKEESSISESRSKSLEETPNGSRTEAKEKEYEAEETLAEQPQQPVHKIQFSDSQSVESDKNDKSVETGEEKTFRDDHCLSSESPKEDIDGLVISHSTANEILPEKLGKEYQEACLVESENPEKVLEPVNEVRHSEDASVASEAEKTFTDEHSVSSEISQKDVDDLAISHSTDNEILTVKVVTEYNEASPVEPENSEKILESVVKVHDSKVAHGIEESDMKEESVEAATTEIGIEKIHQEGTNEAKGTIEDHISSEKIRDEDSPFDCTEKEIIQEECPSKTVAVISETRKSENKGEVARDQEIEASKNIQIQSTDEHEVVKVLNEDSAADGMLNKSLGEEEEREYTDEAPKELNPQKDEFNCGHTQTEVKCSAEEVLSSEVQHDKDRGVDDKEHSIEQKSQAQNANINNSLVADIPDLKGLTETESKSTTTDKVQTHAENNTEDQSQQHGEVSEKQDHEAFSPIENTIHGSETTFEASSVTSSEEACLHKDESSVSESRSKSLEEMQHGSTTEAKEKEHGAEVTLAEQPQQPAREIQLSDSQSVENDNNDKSVETGEEKTFRDDHCLSSESPKEDLDDLAISRSTANEILPEKLGKEYHEASPVESENIEKVLESVNQVHYSEDTSVVSQAEKKDVDDLAISHSTDNEILTVKVVTQYNEASPVEPENSEKILESEAQVHDSKVAHGIEESDMKEESVEAAITEIGIEKIHQEGTNEAKGTIEYHISSEKIRDEDSPIDCTEKEIIQEEVPSKTVLVISETIKSDNEREEARDQEIEASKNIQNQNTDEHEVAKGLHDDSTADSMLNKSLGEEEEREYTDETPKELNLQKDFDELDSGHTQTEVKCSTEEGLKGVTENIVSEVEHEAVLHESTKDSDINNKSSAAVETKKVAVAEDSNSSRSLMDHETPDVRPVETLSEENEASRDFSLKRNEDNEDEPGALSPRRAAFEENSKLQEEQHYIIGTQPTEDNSIRNNEECNKDEEAEEKNENQATAATGAGDTKGGEADSQTSITEGEDQNSHYSDVKLAGLSPKQSSADISHIDEHLDVAEPTDVVPDVIDLSKASPAATEMEIPEESQPSESSEVLLPTAGKDTELLQKDLAITTVQNEIQKVESESDPIASETDKVESEEKGTSNEPKVVEQDSTTIEPATDSESNLMQGSASETLSVAEERETLDQMAQDHISEHPKDSNIGTVQKEDQVDLSSNKNTRAEISDTSSFAVSGNKIAEQKDPEESTEPEILSRDKDIREPKPVSVTAEHEMEEAEQANTSEAMPEAETVEFGKSTTGEKGEGKGTIHDYNQIPESSLLMESTKSASSDLWHQPAEDTIQEAEDIHSQPLAYPRVTVDQKNSTGDKNVPQMQEEAAADNFQTGREFPTSAESSPEEAKSEEEQRIPDEITEATGKSVPTEIANTSASKEETLEIVEHLSERSELIAKQEELQIENAETAKDKEVKTNGAEEEEEEAEMQRGENSGPEVPLTTAKDQEDLTSNKVIMAEMKENKSSAVPDNKIPMQHPEESIKAVISREDRDIQPVLVTGTAELETHELKHAEASEGAGSNKDEEPKEKNEDEALIATRGSVTKQDEADGQSSIAEGEDQKNHDPGVKLERSCPPEKSSLDIPHIDDAPDVSKPTETAQDLIEKNKISLATEEMAILEESQARESTVVTMTSAGSDVQLPQEDPAVTIQDGIEKLKTEIDPSAASSCEPSPETTEGKEQQTLTDEREEATKKSLPTETANTSAFDKETLQIDENLSQKSELMAKKEELNTENAERDEDEVKANEAKDEEEKGEVQREEISSYEVPLMVEKDPAGGKSIITETEMREDSSNVLPDNNIPLQGDPEESIDTAISSENKDIQPVSVTRSVELEIDKMQRVDASEVAASSKDEEAKEKNEYDAPVETRRSVTHQDEADSRSSIAEGEDQKTHDTGVKLESSSPPQKASTDIHHIDEPLDLSKPTEIASDIVEQDEVSFDKEGMGIPEDPQASESTVVTITSASRDPEESTEAVISNEDKDIKPVSDELKHGDTSEAAGSNNNEQAKETNEDEATVEIRGSVAKQDEVDGESNIAERDNQIYHDAGVKLESSSPPENSSTAIHHIDKLQHISRSTEISDTVEQNEVPVTTKEMGIPEEPQSTESTVVTITNAGRDAQLIQNDPAANTVQAEIQTPKIEDDPNAEPSSKKVKSEEEKRLTDDVEEAMSKVEPTETTNTSAFDKETLQPADDLCEKSEPSAKKEALLTENAEKAEVVEVRTIEAKNVEEEIEVQREEHSGSKVPLIVEKDIVDGTSNKTMMVGEKQEDSSIPEKKILVQGDPEESTEAMISNEDEDIQLVSDELKHGDTSEAAGSNNNEQAKEKNEDEATVEIRGSLTKRDEAEGQSNIAEGEDQKYHDAGVEVESSSSPAKSSTDIHHIDEPQDLSRPTELSDTVKQSEVSVTTKGMGIPEEPLSIESTVVTVTSVGRDARLTQNDPAATAVQAEIQTPKTEDDPNAEQSSKKVKGEEEKRLTDDVEEATRKFKPTETATTSALDKETLRTAEYLCEKSKPLAEKEELQTKNAERADVVEMRTIDAKDEKKEREVQQEDDSGSEIPLVVEKDTVDGTSNKTMMVAAIEEDSSSAIPDKKILGQGDAEESIKTVIYTEDKDIQPASVTETIKPGIDEMKHGDAFEAAGSNRDDQAKEMNEDEATVEPKGSVTERDEADGESSITEREDQKIHDPSIELNSSSPPEKTSTGICHIDEPLDLPEPTQIAPDIIQKNEVSIATKAMGIPEEPQSTESTVVMIASAGRDLQLPQDLAAIGIEAEIHKQKSENDTSGASSSEEAKSEEKQTLTDDIKEASRKSLATETATTSAFDDETLQIAEDLSEKGKQIAKKEELHTENAEKAEDKEMNTNEAKDEKEVGKVQSGENSTSEVPLEFEKDRVDDTSNKIITATEMGEYNTSVIPEEKILVQGDTEESIETIISREGKDIEPLSVTGTIKLEIDEQKQIDDSEAAGSNKDREAKYEDEATVAKGASETKQDEADNQSSIIEGEDPKIRDPDVKLESSSSPEQSSTDIHQIDEPLDLKKSTETAQEITELTKVCTANKEMEITEESPSSKHTDVTTTSAEKDVQLLQNDPAVTAVQDEVGKAKTENDLCPASEAATLDPEAKGTIDQFKEMEQESTSMEPATNSESDIRQGSAEQTLSVAEERETPDQLVRDHVYNHDKSSNMGIVQKEVQFHLSSNRKECSEAMISSGDEHIPQQQAVSLTIEHDTEEIEPGNASSAVAVTERAEIGDNERIGEGGEQKENIDDNNQIPESSKSLKSTKSAPTDLWQRSAKDTIQEAEDIGSPDQHEDLNVIQQIEDTPVRAVKDCGVSDIKITQKTEELEAAPLLPSQKHTEPEADPRMTVDPENSSSHKNAPQNQEEEAATDFRAGKEIPRSAEPSPEEEKGKEEHKVTNKIKEKMEKSLPAEIGNASAYEKETPDIAEHSSERSSPKAKNEELPTENAESAEDKEVKTDETKEKEVKRDVQTGENSVSEVPFMVEKESVDLRSNTIITAETKDDSSSVVPETKIPEENMKTVISVQDQDIQPVPLTGNVELEIEAPKHIEAFEPAAKANSAECGEEKRTSDEHKETPESSISVVSAESPASDFQQASAKETTGKAEDIESKDPESFLVPPQPKGSTIQTITKDGVNDVDITCDKAEAVSPLASEEHTVLKGDPKVIPEPENSQDITKSQQEAASKEYQAGAENSNYAESGCEQVKAKAEQRTSDETKESKGKSPPSETANSSASLAEHFNEESKQVTKKKDELRAETAERAEGETVKSDEEESSSYEAPVMVEAPTKDAEAKVSPRKSHNILSGVGSKVKHSIAKVKKAITCTHTQTIPPSPKRE